MKRILKPALLPGLCAVLAGCTTSQESAMDNQVAALSPCEKVSALIDGHKQGFPHLRMSGGKSSGIAQVWKARYHLVGESCQVWGWGSGKFSYVCSQQEPGEELAREHLEQAKIATRQCLDDAWTMQEKKRDMGEGSRIDFTKANETTVISIVAAASPTLMKTEWRTYYFVGDPSDIK